MSITKIKLCPRCGIETDGGLNRMITDSCGHCKCRQCFLADDHCLECTQLKEPASQNSELPSQACVLQQTSNSKDVKRTSVKIPAHIQRIETESGVFQYHCKVCDKHFSRTQQYYHISCGSKDVKPFTCQQCQKTFPTRWHLNYHIESHAKGTFECDQCNKTFKNKLILRKHVKLHSTPSKKCEICEKTFRSKESLCAHLTKHQDTHDLPFQCNICEKRYALKSTMHQHMLKHSEKKYTCPHCNKRFQRNSTLKFHIKKHTKTDSFICMTCYSKFSDAGVLLRHAKMHQDPIKYRCIQCDITTLRKDNMLRHIRNMHICADFDNCVEIIKPNVSSSDMEKQTSPKSYETLENFSNTEPKTLKNSSVIKCVGNVEPMSIPNCSKKEQNINISFETDNPTSTIAVLENVPLNRTTETAVQKKVKKEYDPIEMYRKILTSDCEVANEVEGTRTTLRSHQVEAVAMPPTLEKRLTINTSNFSEMHWRKNFKYTYEYQEY